MQVNRQEAEHIVKNKRFALYSTTENRQIFKHKGIEQSATLMPRISPAPKRSGNDIRLQAWENGLFIFVTGVWRYLRCDKPDIVPTLVSLTIRPLGNIGEKQPKKMPIHIGQLIKEVFDQQPKQHTVKWFAEQLNCRRGNIYDIFNRSTVDTELLARISTALNHDFFADLSAGLRDAGEESVR